MVAKSWGLLFSIVASLLSPYMKFMSLCHATQLSLYQLDVASLCIGNMVLCGQWDHKGQGKTYGYVSDQGSFSMKVMLELTLRWRMGFELREDCTQVSLGMPRRPTLTGQWEGTVLRRELRSKIDRKGRGKTCREFCVTEQQVLILSWGSQSRLRWYSQIIGVPMAYQITYYNE